MRLAALISRTASRGLVAAATLLAALLLAAPAHAALKFRSCGDFAFKCARLKVPLDRTGKVPGSVSLLVKRAAARTRPRRGVLVAFAGGPGQSATAAFGGDSLGPLAEVLRTHDLLVFDQRGTGHSGLLRCPELERANILRAAGPAGRCASLLGVKRAFYTSRDTADDLEAIRTQIGAPTLSLYGVSYGTRTALSYALRHPTHVDRMVLDSVVPADGPDALSTDSFRAVPRVLAALCRGRDCDSFTRDPVGDVARLVARMAAKGPLKGRLVDARGRAARATAGRYDLFSALLAGDFEPELRRQYPAAVTSALHGDAAPMLRLKRRAIALESAPTDPRELSTALYAATTCEEGRLPWGRASPFATRRAQAVRAVGSLSDSLIRPFDKAAVLGGDVLDLCSRWPESPVDPTPGAGPLPDVPTLLVEGSDDLRTPVESARAVAAQLPRSQVVPVRGVGHSPISIGLSRCATRLVPSFFRGRGLPRVCSDAGSQGPGAVAPRSLTQVAPLAGVKGRPGRAAAAVRLTLRDIVDDIVFAKPSDSGRTIRGGGLRGGRYVVGSRDALAVKALSFVPGVRIDGRIIRFGSKKQHGRLRVRGPRGTRGVLRIRGRHLAGRLGGRRVSGSLRLGLASLSRARAAAASRPRRLR